MVLGHTEDGGPQKKGVSIIERFDISYFESNYNKKTNKNEYLR